MVPLIGLLFWILALTAFTRVLWTTIPVRTVRRRDAIVWGLLGILAAGMLFRPHENILGGHDTGAYLNSAVSYSKHGTLFHTDPLLAQIPSGARAGFFYGPSSFFRTKDVCLLVRDPATALIGPWFQPVFSMMMSSVASVKPFAVLFVTPLLALMVGIVLACLAARLIARPWAAPAAFCLYVLMPVIAWNARWSCAEFGASFFLFAGWALLLKAWPRPRWQGWHDLVLGTICVGVAPFFHITAWHPVLATFLILVLIALAGRDDFLLAIPLAVLTVAGFVAQTRFITDCYEIWRFIEPAMAWLRLLVPAIFAGLAILIVLSLRMRRNARSDRWPDGWRLLRLALVIGPPLLILAVYALRNNVGQLPLLPHWTANYLTLTDIRGVLRLTSPLVSIAALVGWIWLAWRRDTVELQRQRLVFMTALLPGILLTGWMDDYMMETRRLILVPTPMMALCVAALIAELVALRLQWTKQTAVVASVVLLGTMLWHKTHLYTVSEYRGFHRFLGSFAREVTQNDGLLLAEYSRVAAPFEHFFGIPLLSIDSNRHNDYRQHEQAWLQIMKSHPGKPCFFLSPYPDPLSENFDFVPVRRDVFNGVRMKVARHAIPDGVQPCIVPLYLYRMSIKSPAPRGTTVSFVRIFDGGNMGLRRFSAMVKKPQQAQGCALLANADTQISWSPRVTNAPSKDLFLFINARASGDMPPRLMLKGGSANVQWTPLIAGWWSVLIRDIPAASSSFTLCAGERGLLLANIIEHSGDITLPVSIQSPARNSTAPLPPFTARWAGDGADLLLPAPSGLAANLFVLIRLGSDQPGEALGMALNHGAAIPAGLTPGVWEWRVMPLTAETRSNNVACISFHASPPWRSGIKGYPDDLAVLVGSAVMRSAFDPPAGVGAP